MRKRGNTLASKQENEKGSGKISPEKNIWNPNNMETYTVSKFE